MSPAKRAILLSIILFGLLLGGYIAYQSWYLAPGEFHLNIKLGSYMVDDEGLHAMGTAKITNIPYLKRTTILVTTYRVDGKLFPIATRRIPVINATIYTIAIPYPAKSLTIDGITTSLTLPQKPFIPKKPSPTALSLAFLGLVNTALAASMTIFRRSHHVLTRLFAGSTFVFLATMGVLAGIFSHTVIPNAKFTYGNFTMGARIENNYIINNFTHGWFYTITFSDYGKTLFFKRITVGSQTVPVINGTVTVPLRPSSITIGKTVFVGPKMFTPWIIVLAVLVIALYVYMLVLTRYSIDESSRGLVTATGVLAVLTSLVLYGAFTVSSTGIKAVLAFAAGIFAITIVLLMFSFMYSGSQNDPVNDARS